MNILFGAFIGLIALTLLVVIHEFVHFIMAKKSGVKVNEFGIGLPPRKLAWLHLPAKEVQKFYDSLKEESKTKVDQKRLQKLLAIGKDKTKKDKFVWLFIPSTEYKDDRLYKQEYLIFGISLLPLGGFCTMDGESDAETKPHTFGATNYLQKTAILFGGVTMNWIYGVLIFTILAVTGMPQFMNNQFNINEKAHFTMPKIYIDKILENSPASHSTLKANTVIHDAKAKNEDNWKVLTSTLDVQDFNKSHLGQTVIYRTFDPATKDTSEHEVTLNSGDNSPALGISMRMDGQFLARYSVIDAPLIGLGTTAQITGETFRGLYDMIRNLFSGIAKQITGNQETRESGKQELAKAGESVSGPVGIIGVIFPSFVSAGFTELLFLTAIISISLACMNVLPIPALDGGRWTMITISKLIKKKLSTEAEGKIIATTFLFLFAMFILVTILDVYLPILAIITFYAAQFIVGVPMLIILGSDTLKTPLIATIFSVLVYVLSFIFLLFTFKHIKPLKTPVTRNEFGLNNLVPFSDIGLALAGFFGYLAFSAILTALFSVFSWFNLTETQPLLYSTLISPSGKILAALALVVAGPILEEVIYRGLIYGKLRKNHSLITSILTVSILFGFLHGQWNVGVDVFALSVVACLMRETTGTIYAGIILHMLKNAIAFYLLFIA